MSQSNGTNIPPGYVEIHGTLYRVVAARVGDFWKNHSPNDYGVRTQILHVDDATVRIRAEIVQHGIAASGPYEIVVATGHAEESRTAGNINRTAAIENCETSAIGRALASIGYGGSETEFASAEERLAAMRRETMLEKGEMSPVKMRKYVDGMLDAVKNEDASGLLELTQELTQEQKMWLWSTKLRSYERTAIGNLMDKAEAIANPQVEPDISGAGSPPPLSEKDQLRKDRREANRRAKQ